METIQGDLADLRALCAVIDHGGLTRAGQILGETKGTVSRRITRLEQQLGVRLLNRTSRAVSPTEEGLAFQRRVVQALALLDEGATELHDARLEPSGHLRVTMPVDLGLYVFAPLIAEFMIRYPQISVEVIMTETFLDLAAYQIDVAFRAAFALTDSQYIVYRLAQLPIQLFASPAYLAQRPAPATLAELNQHRLLLHQICQSAKPIQFALGNVTQRLSLTPHLLANDFAWLKQVALTGAGIASLPRLLCEADCRTGTLAPVLSDWSLAAQGQLYLLHESRRLLPAKVTCFREFMRQRFAG
ncbi:MAG: LysR family transcriptional regulator [Elainella sp.]